MLTRFYVDNFRCLVNFELKLDRVNLLLGDNGSGKTTVFDALHRLQEFVIGDARVHEAFPGSNMTRWQTLNQQAFELELSTSESGIYTYKLVVEHDQDRRKMRVHEEKLELDGKPLFLCQEGMAQLYRDNHSEGPKHPFDWTLSGLGFMHERPDNKKLTQFKREFGKIIIARPTPPLMGNESRREHERLELTMENFVSWYRHFSQEHMGAIFSVFRELEEALPSFKSLSLKESGEDSRALKVLFARPGGGKELVFDFSELSDGQRMIIALYTLLYGLRDEGVSLFIDEPDNFIALREIQPWLVSLVDACGDSIEQAVLISHHPEIINYLGSAHGRWLEREGQGPVRVADAHKIEGLTLSETIVRGWQA